MIGTCRGTARLGFVPMTLMRRFGTLVVFTIALTGFLFFASEVFTNQVKASDFEQPQAIATANQDSEATFPLKPINLSYEVWFGGFNVAAAEVEFTFQDNAYSLSSVGETKGIAALLADWRGTVKSEGRILSSGTIQPALHRQVSEWRGEARQVMVDYDEAGEVISYSVEPERDPDDEDEINPLPPNPEIGTIDPLSVIAGEAIFSTKGVGCDAVYPVFDGRRRYDLTLMDKGEIVIERSEYTIFSGTVQACEVTFKMLGGDRKEKSKYAKTARNRTIFLGRPVANGPVVPVRLRVETDYGLLIAHLTGFEMGGQKLALQQE